MTYFQKSDKAKMDGNISLASIFLGMALDERMGVRFLAPTSSDLPFDEVELIGEIYSDYEETMQEFFELSFA